MEEWLLKIVKLLNITMVVNLTLEAIHFLNVILLFINFGHLIIIDCVLASILRVFFLDCGGFLKLLRFK